MVREKSVLIVGGGLAGLVSALHLTRQGIPCIVMERKQYPFHRVCGEYVSNEVVPYLTSLGAMPDDLSPARIKRFQLTSVSGRSVIMPLDLGGFGLSRYRLDQFLYQKGLESGVHFRLNTEVRNISFDGKKFRAETENETVESDVVIGAFGKRSRMDQALSRPFIKQRSPYAGVKYHLRLPGFPEDLIALHNFKLGYCGISHVEDNILNLCYLTHRDNLRMHRSISAMEKAVLYRNPYLKRIFEEGEFLIDPETINEISFAVKAPVDQHILMSGDAAGMITPLCGNGMAMAIHSAKIVSEHILQFCKQDDYPRERMENEYADAWRRQFARRLWIGRNVQHLFGSVTASNLAVDLARYLPPVARELMRRTHGKPFG